MKNVLVGVLICFLMTSCVREVDCDRFRNGKFRIVDENYGDSFIDRKDGIQIEYGEKLQIKTKFKVNWLDECTYTLELIEILENPKEIPDMDIGILTVSILETKENSYFQHTSSSEFSMEGWVEKYDL